MWITPDVELPQDLVDQQAQGQLVLFIGAGVSVAPPSDLPLFGKLVDQLADRARSSKPTAGEALDRYLGEMPKGFDVHSHAHEILSPHESRPNDTHEAVMQLAAASGDIRVVTTNFDDHLLTSANSANIEVPDVWFGPALPLGESFSGLVHLHGSLTRPARELVLDDQDFSRAYMTQAWATRFLLPMFQKYAVLFIGYSHDDTVMSYLARGLPSKTKRYVLTTEREAEEKKWSNLGIEPVSYPLRDGSHSALSDALRAWNTRVRMGLSEHRSLIGDIVAGGPTLTPVDRDYLLGRLQREDGAQQFCRAVAGLEKDGQQLDWLVWIEGFPQFRALFAGGKPGPSSTVLANWFSDLTRSPGLSDATLRTVQRLGQRFSDDLFSTMKWAAQDIEAIQDQQGPRQWRTVLATSIHGQTSPAPTQGLLTYEPTSSPVNISVLRPLLKPHLQLEGTVCARLRADGIDDRVMLPRAELRWVESEEILTKHIQRLVGSSAAERLILALSEALSEAYDLHEAYHGAESFDGISGLRSAIEPHEQDDYRNPLDAIIDGLRDCGEKLVEAHAGIIEFWWRLDRPLFRRLALHLLVLDGSRTNDEKLEWLLDRNLLYEPFTKHETYRVLEKSVAGASAGTLARLIREVRKGPPNFDQDDSEDAQRFDYMVYNLIVWLTRAAPTWTEAQSLRGSLEGKNPVFQPRDNPDLDVVVSKVEWVDERPWGIDETTRRLEDDLARTLDQLLSLKDSVPALHGPTWRGGIRQMREVAEARPDLGDRVCTSLMKGAHLEAKPIELIGAVLEGWSDTGLGVLFDRAVGVAKKLATDTRAVGPVSRFLLGQVRKHADSPDTWGLLAMRQTAWTLWDQHGTSFVHPDGLDPVSVAPLYLNSWPGNVAQYWVTEIDRRWRNERENWHGLTDEEHRALESLLNGSNYVLNAVQPALARQVYFLFAADERFSTEHLLPLFFDRERARLAWNPYLHGARINDRMLQAGFLDAILDQWERLEDLQDDHLHQRFLELVVSIVSFSGVSEEDRLRLLDGSVLALDGKCALDFARQTLRFLSEPGINGQEVWVHWLKNHVLARLAGTPRKASTEELTIWADVVPYLGESLSEGIQIFAPQKLPLTNGHAYRPKAPEAVGAQGAEQLASYFAARLSSTSSRDYGLRYRVRRLREELSALCGEAGVEPLSRAELDHFVV